MGRLEAQVRELLRGSASAPAPAAAPEEVDDTAPFKTAPKAAAPEPPAPEPGPKAVAATGEPAAREVTDEPGAEAPAEPAAAPPAAAAADIDLRHFESSWPVIVARVRDELGPRRHSLLKEAVPVAVENGVVTLHLPKHLPFHLEQLQADTRLHDAVSAIALESLGGTITLAFGSADAAPTSASVPERAPDKELMLDDGDDETDPAALVVDILGGEIVSE
jgi:hypothetical protein